MSIETNIWRSAPSTKVMPRQVQLLYGQHLHNRQMVEIHDRTLLGHIPIPPTVKVKAESISNLKWINRGEFIAGSHCIGLVRQECPTFWTANDVDIYFKCFDDALEFSIINNFQLTKNLQINTGCHFETLSAKINVIWGIPYNSTEELISGFDIRACAIAYDVANQEFTYVDGALEDIKFDCITFQTSARNISITRLLKYSKRSYEADKYQRVILSEMIKAGFHDPEIELKMEYK